MKRIILSLLLIFSVQTIVWAEKEELPRTNRIAEEQVIEHLGYTTSYNQMLCIPNWVAWELTAEEVAGKYPRAGEFQPDPMVQGMTATTYDYAHSGYDRGHMAPAADMKWSQQAMEESFYLTNICPQDHDLNAGQWEDLEKKCRAWAKVYDKIWICCGPIMLGEPNTIGDNYVMIPTGFFKVICVQQGKRYETIGFVFPNARIKGSFWDYVQPLATIEKLTGHTFFNKLEVQIQRKIKGKPNLPFWKSPRKKGYSR